MDQFTYREGVLYAEGVPIDRIADEVGSPAYVYSKATLLHHFRAIRDAFAALDPVICYSIKSCQNIHLCKLLAEAGAGMDVVSGGEIVRAQAAGADPRRIVYAGVGKTDAEIELALNAGIGYFNIESEAEFENIAAIARRLGKTARGALRVNPDVADPKTHAKTTTGSKETKFGVDIERAKRFFEAYGGGQHLKLTAIHLHIGSPIYSGEPYARAIGKAMGLVDQLRGAGHTIDAIDIGGGYGADYETGATPAYADYAREIVPLLKPFVDGGGTVILEPGRTIAANAGVLLAEVLYIKTGGTKTFAIVDTGMHHLIRPTLYDAWQFIWPTTPIGGLVPPKRAKHLGLPGLRPYDVVGPICETGDYLALGRELPELKRGDRVAVFSAGAYGMVMASNYNTMPRPAEVLVDGDTFTVIRRRETYDDLLGPEREAVGAAVGA